MTIRKSVFNEASEKLARRELLHEPDIAMSQRPVQQVEVTALLIDHDYGLDCDPYNRTGKFFVVGMKKGEEPGSPSILQPEQELTR